MIFAEVASRVGLLGKVNLPREPGERARVERRKRKGAEMGRLYRATARKSPTKLRRCLSHFALRSLGEMHRGVPVNIAVELLLPFFRRDSPAISV